MRQARVSGQSREATNFGRVKIPEEKSRAKPIAINVVAKAILIQAHDQDKWGRGA